MLESSLSNFKIIVSHLTPLIAFNINPSLIQQKKEINLAFKNLITDTNLRACGHLPFAGEDWSLANSLYINQIALELY